MPKFYRPLPRNQFGVVYVKKVGCAPRGLNPSKLKSISYTSVKFFNMNKKHFDPSYIHFSTIYINDLEKTKKWKFLFCTFRVLCTLSIHRYLNLSRFEEEVPCVGCLNHRNHTPRSRIVLWRYGWQKSFVFGQNKQKN
jgi:hypothetical protein